MSTRPTHRVSCKAAVFSPDGTQVILMKYAWTDSHGLPGGHMEGNEHPDETIRRELSEEIGAIKVALQQQAFWRHQDGRVILGYVGAAQNDAPLLAIESHREQPRWVALDDIKSGIVDVGTYKEFILANCKEN